MLNVSIALRLILSLAVVVAITLLLWYEKAVAHQSGILIFFYLIPIVFVAAVFGSIPAIVAIIVATVFAPMLLYEPLYSWHVADSLGWSDLFWFDLLGLAAIKCTVALLRPMKGNGDPRGRARSLS